MKKVRLYHYLTILFILGGLIFTNLIDYNHQSHKVNASSEPRINFIYSQLTIPKNSEFSLTITIQNITNLYNFQLYLPLNNKVSLTNPGWVIPDKGYFTSSEFIIIENTNQRLKVIAFKETDINPYNTTVIKLNFKALENLNSIDNIFNDYSLFTYDFNMNIINHQVQNTEEIKVIWEKTEYVVDVFSSLPDFKNDITITNRTTDQYYLDLITDELNLNILGNQILKICLYDYTNGAIYYLVKMIKVVDQVKPIITPQVEKIIINSDNLNQIANIINQSVVVNDNYDAICQLNWKVYDLMLVEITDPINYFSSNLNGFVKYQASDQSGNLSSIVTIEITIVDVTAPNLTILEVVEVKDSDLDTFDFISLLTISDNYDPNPKIIIVDSLELSINQQLKISHQITITYFGMDQSGNSTNHYQVVIKLIDTTKPIISNINDLIIEHHQLIDENLFYQQLILGIEIIDLIDPHPTLYLFCYDSALNPLTFSQLYQLLLLGQMGYIDYQAIDNSLNSSEKVRQKIEIIDSTAPVIKVLNIEDGKKYFNIKSIELQITDNLDQEINYTIYLNEILYTGGSIDQIGNHVLLIEATDNSGNQSSLTITFTIIKNDLISCLDDAECYLRNYRNIVYLAGGVIIAVIMITVTKVLYHRRKRDHQL